MSIKILLPVDSSTFAQAATRVAFQLAKGLPGASLHVLSIVNVRTASGNVLNDLKGYVGFEPAVVSQEVYDAHNTAANAVVEAVVARAKAEGITATGTVATGAVTDQLVAAADHADLVVMGSRGESEDRFPGQGGAQAANAMPKIDIPVLLVPREVTRLGSFAVGYDGSASASHALRIVGKLASGVQVPVHLIYVGEPVAGEPLLKMAEDDLGEGIETVRHLTQGTEVHKTLIDTAREAGADCLVLGFAGKSKLKDVVFGSARDHLLNKDLRVAVLIAH